MQLILNIIFEISSYFSISFAPAYHVHKSSRHCRDVQILSKHSQWLVERNSALSTSELVFYYSTLPLGHRALQLC